jgi:hypothetical protein
MRDVEIPVGRRPHGEGGLWRVLVPHGKGLRRVEMDTS